MTLQGAGRHGDIDGSGSAQEMDLGLPMPPERARVAVCLAVHNGLAWLPDQVDSILGQQGVELGVIVSVDVSTDGSEQWADEMARRHECLSVLPSGRRFGGAAANFFRLLSEADFDGFDYIALSDQDDIWFPDKLARAVDVMKATGADAYSSNVIAFWPDGRRVFVDKAQSQQDWDHFFEAAGPGCTYVMSADLVRAVRTVLRERGGDAGNIGLHDWFLYAFARARGYHWKIDDRPGLFYRQHGRNEVGVNIGLKALLKRARRVGNGWAFAQARLIADVVGASDHELVRRGLSRGRAGAGWLALRVGRCRRRPRDRFFFFISCLVQALCWRARR